MSTEIMLQKMRSGDYFCALEWLMFVESSYALANEQLGLDTLLPLATYELVTHGFKLEDAAFIKILYAIINDSTLFAIPGKYAYANMTLIGAAFQCLVYLDCDLLAFYQNKPDDVAVLDWMHRDNQKLDAEANSEAIKHKTAVFDGQLATCQTELLAIQESIRSASHYQTLCEGYLERLEALTSETDSDGNFNQSVRLGVVKSLHDYLSSQLVLTPEIKVTVENYVKKIRKLNPASWEEDILCQMSPLTRVQNLRFFAWSVVRGIIPLPEGQTPVRNEGP